MKIVERVAYGERGQGSLVRYAGVATWFSVYCQRGAERRRTTGETDFKAARKAHKKFLDALAAEREGHKVLPAPLAARVTVGELLDDLEADFRLRGVKWWKQAKYHAAVVREWFGDTKATKLGAADVDRYIEAKQKEDYASASINRQTGLLAQALRLAHRRGTLASVIAVRRLPERNARQGFLERADFDKVVASLPDYLQDLVRFAYLTAWRRGELVFHRQGHPVGDFRKAWAAACIEAGLYHVVGTNADGTEKKSPDRLFHDLRRSGVRNMVRAGVRERVAMEISGHRTRSIFDRYNIVSEEDLRSTMQRQSEYVARLPKGAAVTALPLAHATPR